MKFTATDIADLIQGEIFGDAQIEVSEPAKIEEGAPGCISFLANPKYEDYLYNTKSSIVIISKDLELKSKVNTTLIKVDDPYLAFSTLLQHYNDLQLPQPGMETPHFIAEDAKVGMDVYIGAFAYIGSQSTIGDNVRIFPQVYIGPNVEIGDNSILYPGVKIYRDCKVGENSILHAGTIIGSDGFGYVPTEEGMRKVPQTGNVEIGDNVEIGANTTIDRATMGSTRILDGVKLDNLVQIAHNVELGEHTAIAAQAGISGSTKLGKGVQVGGQAGFVGHVSIADGVKVNAQSGVSKGIQEPGKAVTGSPAVPFREFYKSQVVFSKLPELEKRIIELEEKLSKS